MTRGTAASSTAVLFDLDDTLLFSDMENSFLNSYFALLSEYAAPHFPPDKLIPALLAGTDAVQRAHDPALTNEQVFAATFAPLLGQPWPGLRVFFAVFYEERFPQLRVHTHPHPQARQIVADCFDAGYRVAIATNPLFPARAIQHRLSWAGLEDMPFDLVTSYENMHTCKPSPDYYIEIASLLDVPPAACWMVGNDVARDIAPAKSAGMHAYLADEWLVNDDPGIHPDCRGRLADLVPYLRRL